MLKLVAVLGSVTGGVALCVCSQACKLPSGAPGVCQANGDCIATMRTPVCFNAAPAPISMGATSQFTTKTCPMLACSTPVCGPSSVLQTPKGVDGCPQCSYCAPLPVSATSWPQALAEPCECGKPCKFPSGSTGICQTNGDCGVFTNIKPQCPNSVVKCDCGKFCKMLNGDLGVCQDGGECAVNVPAPKCSKKDKKDKDKSSKDKPPKDKSKSDCGPCGSPCKSKKNKSGFCQADGDCKSGKTPPVCELSTGKICPKLKCVAITCPVSQQVIHKNADGCPLCPACEPAVITTKECPMIKCAAPNCALENQETPMVDGCRSCPRCKPLCTNDQNCTGVNMFCHVASKTCVEFSKTGDSCTPMIPLRARTADKRCMPGSACNPATLRCAVCAPISCPTLQCTATEPTPQSNGCPGCRRCKAEIGV